jgi:uncharacterized RDD family membrane protein YckC
METITVHTTQNIGIEYEVGGLGERMVARLIDIGIFIPLAIAGGFLARLGSALTWYYYILLGLFAFYDLLCEVFFNGQSLGKRIMKIRVISMDGARPRFSQYLLRWLFRLIDFAITWPGIVALVSAVVTENSQRLGDLVAGTIMIRSVPRTKINSIVYTVTDESYEPVFAQANQLSDNDAALIHEVISAYVKTGNTTIVYTLADKIRESLGINLPPNMNSMQFLQTLLKDYSHVTAHAELV